MRVLLDTCMSHRARRALEEAGHDVDWAGAWPSDPGDVELLRRAEEEARVLITLDKDFGELAVVRGLPHAGIVRLVDFSARAQGAACVEVLGRYEDALARRAIVTVERARVRVRLDPD